MLTNLWINMEELELFDRAMNVGYNMLLGVNKPFVPNDSDELEDMVLIPDPEATDLEIAEDLLEYFESTEEYEKCANIRDVINNIKTIDICLK